MNNENKELPAVINSGFFSKAKSFLLMLCRSNIKASGTQEFFSMPVIVFLAILLLTWRISIPVFIISLFCSVEYTITGGELQTEKKISFRPGN